ncbi:MAG: DUF779 domain-containing protein [Nocardioides sp.]|uniref:DUF779 domain-containing protein n=1 Tax=Nocardioides sp. TaxID=35761 RepID=UPI0039E6D612
MSESVFGVDPAEAAEVAPGVTATPSRVAVTPAAAEMIRTLTEQHGPVMFHQSGGCCDGSAPMCYPYGEFLTGDSDVHLGDLEVSTPETPLEPVEVWMSREQFAYWSHTHLTIDLVPGRGAGFSLEGPTGFRFLLRSRLFTDEEAAALPPLDDSPPR